MAISSPILSERSPQSAGSPQRVEGIAVPIFSAVFGAIRKAVAQVCGGLVDLLGIQDNPSDSKEGSSTSGVSSDHEVSPHQK